MKQAQHQLHHHHHHLPPEQTHNSWRAFQQVSFNPASAEPANRLVAESIEIIGRGGQLMDTTATIAKGSTIDSKRKMVPKSATLAMVSDSTVCENNNINNNTNDPTNGSPKNATQDKEGGSFLSHLTTDTTTTTTTTTNSQDEYKTNNGHICQSECARKCYKNELWKAKASEQQQFDKASSARSTKAPKLVGATRLSPAFEAKKTRQKHPLDAASLISKVFFGNWTRELEASKWLEKNLPHRRTPSSSYPIPSYLDDHEEEDEDFYGDSQRPRRRRPSLARAVIKTHASWILFNSLLTFFSEVVCKSFSAYSVGQMLMYMNKRELVDHSKLWTTQDPLVFWSISLVSAVFCWVLTAHFYGFQMMRVGLHVRLGCSYLIYRKSLALGQYESSQTTMGKMTNLLSNDLDKFNYVCLMVPFIWIGPIQTVVSLYLLWPILGPACLGSVLVLSILTPIQFFLSRKFASFRRRIAAYTDERVRLLAETITVLQLIKLYGWEYSFRASLAESRRKETDLINRVSIIKGISSALMYVSSKLVLFVTIIFHSLIFGGTLDAQTLFMSMAMLNNVQFTMTQLLPRAMSLGVESLVSLSRITDFLLAKEFVPSDKLDARAELYDEPRVGRMECANIEFQKNCYIPDLNRLFVPTDHLMHQSKVSNKKLYPSIECHNVGSTWPMAETKAIEGVSFKVESPSLVIVCGQLASGKSSLILSLLNELPICEGRACIRGSYNYSSQEAWIFNGTVRDNILFGQDYDEQRYQEILEICALKRDLELLECSDFTYIQENTLSGGQKARVNLARCLYRDCDIYLLDDPFSAIDNRVSTHIFDQAVKRFLSNKLVLLTTHQVRFLKQSDKILLLDRGRQLSFCDYDTLGKRFLKSSNKSGKGQCFTHGQLKNLRFLTKFLDDDLNHNGVKHQQAVHNYHHHYLDDIIDGDNHDQNVESIQIKETSLNNMLNKRINSKELSGVGIDNVQKPRRIIDEEKEEDEEEEKNDEEKCSESSKELEGKHEDNRPPSNLAIETNESKSSSDLVHCQSLTQKQKELSNSSSNGVERPTSPASATEQAPLKCNREGMLIGREKKQPVASVNHALQQQQQPHRRQQLEQQQALAFPLLHLGGEEKKQNKPDDDKTKKRPIAASSSSNHDQEEATSGSTIHAPYGFLNLVCSKKDKTLITVPRVDGGSEARSYKAVKANTDVDDQQREERGGASEKEEGHKQQQQQQLSPASKVDDDFAGSVCERDKQLPITEPESHYRTTKNQINKQNEQEFGKGNSTNSVSRIGELKTKSQKLDEHDSTKAQESSSHDCNACGESPPQRLNEPAGEESSSNKLPGWRIWYTYYTQTSVIRLALIILTFLITQTIFSTIDIYLTVWSLSEHNKALVNEIREFNQQQQIGVGILNEHQYDGLNNRTNIIEYDLILGDRQQPPEEQLPSFLTSLLLSSSTIHGANNSTTNDFDGLIKIAREILKASISPLSSRSSHLLTPLPPLSAASMNDFFVHPQIVDLFYTTPNTTADHYNYIYYQKQQKYYHDHHHHSSSNYARKPQYQQQKFQRNQITSPNSASGSSYGKSSAAILTSDDEGAPHRVVMVDRNLFEESEAALNVKSIYRPLYLFVNNFTSLHHALTYMILLMVLFSCSAITNVLSLTSSNKSAISLYKKLTDNALFAKMAFFDQNPIGRFLNRATRDIGIIDEAIPYNANQAYDALLQTAATFIVVAAVDITLTLPSLIILLVFLIYHSIHVKPTMDIQRLEGISKSPIISHISTTLTGINTIRATKSEQRFEQLFMKHQDAHTSIFLLYLGCNRTMAIVLDSLNASYTAILVFWAVISGLSGPSAGLIITSAMLLSGLTQHGVMKLTETESLMTSVERVIEYCSLPQEVNYDSKGRGKKYHQRKRKENSSECSIIPHNSVKTNNDTVWPIDGCIEYRQVDLYYNKKQLDKPVLKNISFKLEPGEKVGIVGRTGAGKSSIITTLFRLYDYDGTILIDGVDIKQVDLLELRTSIAIIPQNPVIFSTTIRKNLDPLNVYDDFSIWAALDKAHLRTTISALPGKLDYNIGSCGGDGGGFSSGQKQLICLARVLLRRNSIIVMDEATANVDPTTDAIIQTTIRREFKHCTVITIAHRLETILDCDRIMVLEAGRIVSFDTPERLAAKSNSYFAGLLRKASEE